MKDEQKNSQPSVLTEIGIEKDDFYRDLFENAHDGLAIVKLDHTVVHINRSMERLLSRPRKEVVGKDYRTVLTPSGIALAQDRERRLRNGEKISPTVEHEFLRKDGSTVWVEGRVRFLKAQDGTLIGFKGIYHDISERKAAETALQESEKKYRGLYESITDGLIRTDEADCIAECNQAFLDMLGYTFPELKGRHCDDLTPERWYAIENEILVSQVFSRGYSDEYEKEFIKKDGTILPVAIKLWMTKDVHGEKQALWGIVRDISERKQAEALLQARRDFAIQVMSAMGQGLVVTNAESVIEYVNPAITRMLGYQMEEVIGKSSFSFGSPDEQARIQQEFAQRRQGETATYETRVRHADGHYLPTLVTSSPRWRDHTMIGAILIISDLSERKQAEEERRRWEAQLMQAQKMEALGILAGGVAHGFNNILAAMLGYSELIADDLPANSTAHRNLQEIIQAGQRAKDLVQQLLMFSRSNQGEKRWVRLQSIIEETLRFLQLSLPKTVTLQHNLSCPTDTMFAAPAQIQQVVLNLCMNGVQALGKSPGLLAIELQRIDGKPTPSHVANGMLSGPSLRLSVRDTGVGIKPEILPQIFDPFFTTKPIGKGTGLGLAIVHAVVTDHGGTVTVDSQLGYGTTFYVNFPLKPALDPRETAILQTIKEAL